MTKQEFVKRVVELYAIANMADSDNPNREEWTRPEMARTVCCPLDKVLAAVLTKEELETLYANGGF